MITAPLNVHDYLNREAEHKLKVLGARLIQAQRKQDGPATRRIEKSIALAMSKRLCPHTHINTGGITIGGSRYVTAVCRDCKLSTKF